MSLPAERDALLIVASSGRALAASGARSAQPVVVLDLYNDMDTCALSASSRAVADSNGRFNAQRLLAAAAELCPPERCAGLVYGSGLEGRIGLLRKLARNRTLYGNEPDTVALVKDPVRFFGLLDELHIPHPATSLEPPHDAEGWLIKRTGAAGGSHVRQAHKRHRARPRRYFQRYQHGRVLSALFAADGTQAQVLGFNEQWTADMPWCARYCYGGAVTCADLPQAVEGEIARIASRLVAATALKGINGVDFILDGGRAFVLEVNPRPTATIELYDRDVDGGMLALHIRACSGELPSRPRLNGARAHAIVYAATVLRVPLRIDWPAWCTDLPEAGSTIPAGAPVCSVHAAAETAAQARQLAIMRREQMQANLLERAA
ncbi:MAG TPA: ATP-grasp domain-containing protein [Burkholderiales bacterium]|nr:ATP-grasp domain-containing protein [Burkholderiales bacterium]